MANKFYILEDRKPVECTPFVWGQLYQKPEERLVSKTAINDKINVSTSFVGIDRSPMSKCPPLLFETKVSGYAMDIEKFSYSTWEQAVEGHKSIVSYIKLRI